MSFTVGGGGIMLVAAESVFDFVDKVRHDGGCLALMEEAV